MSADLQISYFLFDLSIVRNCVYVCKLICNYNNDNNHSYNNNDAWKLKPLCGQFARENDGSIDVSQQWKWLNRAADGGGKATGAFCPGPHLVGAPGKGPYYLLAILVQKIEIL